MDTKHTATPQWQVDGKDGNSILILNMADDPDDASAPGIRVAGRGKEALAESIALKLNTTGGQRDGASVKADDHQYVAIAEKLGLLAELCVLNTYHPDKGAVPEHWVPRYPQFFAEARACNAHDYLVKALQAEAAVKDLPFLEGEKMLKTLGWNGEQDIQAFIDNLRRAALAKAGAA